jgi:ribose transport system substrate-binding protein
MMAKRAAALIVACLIVAACSSGGSTPSAAGAGATGGTGAGASGASGGAGGTVGLALSTLNNPFFVALRDGAQAQAGQLGLQLQVADGQDTLATQLGQVEDFITKKVGVIIVNPVDSDGIVPAVQKANAANIPVIAVDRSSNGGTVASFIASDNVTGGKMAADFLSQQVPSGNVAVLQGIAGTSAARDRGKGFTDEIQTKSGIKVVASQTADFDRAKALNVMQNILQAHPDIKGVFAENDEMALGAVQAIDAAGMGGKVVVVGFDGIADAISAIEQGKMAGTIAQQPKVMGETAAQTASDILSGKQAPANIPVPVKLVTKDNAAQFK